MEHATSRGRVEIGSAEHLGVRPARDRSRPDPLGGRARLSLVLPVLALLLGALGLLSASPAEAQTAIKLVSNTGQSTTSTITDADVAQAFTTGSNEAGYTLTRVDMQVQDQNTATLTYSVRIHSDSSGRPGDSIGTLTNPASLPTGSPQAAQFTASGGGIDLDANTTYFVMLDITQTNTLDGKPFRVAYTSSDAEDGGAAAGWSIANTAIYRNALGSSMWATAQESRKIAVHGYAKEELPPGSPAKPSGVRVRAGDGQVTFHYLSSRDYQGKKQYRMKSGTGSWGSWTDIPESRQGGKHRFSWTLTGLNNGTAVSFLLRDVNRIGAGPASDVLGPVTPAAAPLPAHIDGLRALPSTNTLAEGRGAVTLRWNDPNDGSITKYQVAYRSEVSTATLAWNDIPNSHALTTRHTLTPLTHGLPLRIWIRAVNASGNGPASDVVTTPGAFVAHGVRLWDLKVEPGDDRVALDWEVLSNSNQSKRVGYVIRWVELANAGNPKAWREHRFGTWSNSPGYTITGLNPGTQYVVQVRVEGPYTTQEPIPVWETNPSTTGTSMAPPVGGPALEWARVRGTELGMRFDKELDESSVPAASAFAVSVAGSARSVSSVSVRQDLVSLTLASAVSSGEAVTVGYTPPSTGKLRLPGGGAEVAAFSGQTVTNDTPAGQPQVQRPPEPVAPLTARFTNAPSEHDGTDGFALRVAFSAPVAARAKDASIQVSGGTLTRAVRVSKRKDLWELRVTPSGSGAVTVTLPATADCAASGAVCTADGRRLETALTHTVQGAVALSVADASAQEGPGATVDFAVTLSRAAAGKVTVRYATKNGTAKKGKDYRNAKGKLVFAAGETSKTVSVTILDDAHDEGTETFRLVLSKPKGAAIADGEAVGTITNSDPLQQDVLARFGRAAAADAVAAVTARLDTPRGAGSHLTLAGQRVDLSDTEGGRAREQALAGFARLLGAPDGAADPAGTEPRMRWLSDIGPADRTGGEARTIRGRELLLGSSFRAVMGGSAGAQWTSWGQGASVSQFASATPTLSLSGETATGSLGMDYERGGLLTGFAMTHSLGEGTAQGAGRSYLMGSAVTTMLPYVRYALSERVSAWGLAGTGSGTLTLDLDGGAPERYGADLSMTLAAVGVRGELVTPAQAGGFALALKADAFWVRTESDSVSKAGAGNLAAARADASRLRAVLDGSRTFALAGGRTLSPSVELGLRHDGGDAETGTGFELGAGIGYADPSRGLDAALRLHGLAAHADDGYSEWGVSGSLRLVPGAAGRGLSASLTPSYGVDPGGGSERLWTLPDASGLAANDDAPLSRRLDAEVGYGLPVFGGGFTGTPNVGMGLSDTARELRLGWRLAPVRGGDFEVHLDAARRDSTGDAPEHRIGVGVTARW